MHSHDMGDQTSNRNSFQLSNTHLFQHHSNLTAFHVARALEEFKFDYPDEVQAGELVALDFTEPMDYQSKELYADLLTARAENCLQALVDKFVEFIDEGELQAA